MAPLSVFEQVRLMHEWAPLLGYGRRLAATLDARERSLVIGDLCEWLASKTQTTLDDRLVGRIVAILKTPEGEALVRDLVAIGDSLIDAMPKEPQP